MGAEAGPQQSDLADEARQRRDTGQVERRDQEQRAQHRRGGRQPAQLVQRGRAATAFDQTGDQEQGGLDEDVVRGVEDRARQAGVGVQRDAEDHVADVTDQGEGEHPFDLALGDGAQDADHHGEDADHQHRHLQCVVGEEHGLGPDHRVHPDLGEQAGEHRGDRRRGGGIGVRQPGGQREDGGLDPEDGDQQEVDHLLDLDRQRGEPGPGLGHVDRAGRGVHGRQRDQEEQ
ncbi:hypothetical protein SDC9_89981 [bioreactor metagenome]|uniref:Uncharacterized protein n=1 Tax=bioreactor metagenome TaxID=1076179 RepID=A0A644ZSE2_9ZZZZ